MKRFGGTALFLDRPDINTDEIIPARYLTEASRLALKPYLLEDLQMDGFDPKRDLAGKGAVVARENFGCGSSREHAAWALEANGIRLVVAPSFARIFRQNMFNCGLLALSPSEKDIDRLFREYARRQALITAELDRQVLRVEADGGPQMEVAFELSDFERALVEAGGWVDLADGKY